MKMKVSGLENVELAGDISGLHESDGYLVMTVRLTTPVGWHARVALPHKDLIALIKLMLKPANLSYVIFGFGKPGKKKNDTAASQ